MRAMMLFLVGLNFWAGVLVGQGDPESFYKSGLVHIDTKNYIMAIGEFTNAVGIKPDYADAYYQRAVAKALLGKQVGFTNTELCFDLVESERLGNHKAAFMIEEYCMSECYDYRTAFLEPEIVFCADFSSKVLTDLPKEAERMNNLVKLVMFNNKLTTLPQSFKGHPSLVILDISSNMLTDLGAVVGALINLDELNLNKNLLKDLPKEFGNLTELRSLYIRNNLLTAIPEPLCKCTHLETLDLSLNKITTVPECVKNLKKLKTLNLVGNEIATKDKKLLHEWLPGATIYFD